MREKKPIVLIKRNTIELSQHFDELKVNVPHYIRDKNNPDGNEEEEIRNKERGHFCAEHVYHQIHSSLLFLWYHYV